MSSSIYQPVSQKFHANDKVPTSSSVDVGHKMDTRCGLWMCKPACLQPMAKVSVFTAIYGLAGLMTQTLTFYVNSHTVSYLLLRQMQSNESSIPSTLSRFQVTTLERQFGFSSYQTGIILAANDIGYLACVLFVAYLAPRTHIPRSLGFATITYGISGIACSLPHFLFGATNNDPIAENINSTESNFSKQSAVVGSLCDIFNNTGDSCSISAAQTALEETTQAASDKNIQISLIIIVIGMALQGFGKAPRSSFAITYIDDNTARVNTAFYAGIMGSTALLGPFAAFLLGGVFSRMYVTLEATQLTPRHPKWIGAWWLGYIVFGLLALIMSIPLFCFPRRMPRKKVKNSHVDERAITGRAEVVNLANSHTLEKHAKKNDILDNHTTHVDGRFGFISLVKHAREFLASLYRLLTNFLYVCLLCATCCLLFLISGHFAFFPKYLERMFHMPAHTANYITAVQHLLTTCTGIFLGGFLTRRFKMTAMNSIKFQVGASAVALFFQFLMFIFQCEQPTVNNWPSEENSCNSGCNCRDNSYFPICGGDGRTYYSPCHAGCLQAEQRVYQNCSCIPGGQATAGTCGYGCSHLYGYVIISGVRIIAFALIFMPKMVVVLRCVPNKDKSMALAVSPFMTSLFGWLLAPIIIGNIIDNTCLIWDIKCLTRGRCLLYDNNQFRLQFHGYTALAMSGNLMFLVIAYLYARWSRCLDDSVNDHTDGVNTGGNGDCTFNISVVDADDKLQEQGLKLDEEKTRII